MTITFHRTGTGTPVLLLHGLGLDRHAWDGLAALAEDWELLACDIPALNTIEDMAEAIAAGLRQQGVNRAHIVGHDLGGLVAQHLAAHDPALVDRLVLCATAPTFNNDDQALWRQYAALARQAGSASVGRALEATWFTQTWLARNPPPLFADCPPERLALACEALAQADTIDLAGEIYARTLVVVGEHDTLAFREAADWLAQSIAGAKIAYAPDAAHAVPLEQPNWTMRALRFFLA